jgi:hypothetical protein
MSLRRFCCLFAILGLVWISSGFKSHHNQNADQPRILSGTVVDQHARPIPQAAVQIENERTLVVRTYITDEKGVFHFAELAPDADYDLRAEFDGIRGPKKILSQFDSRRNPTMKLTIRLPQ